VSGPLPSHVVGDGSSNHLRQWENTVSLTLAANAKLSILDEHIAYLQLENLGRSQSTQQHQVNEREVAVAPKAAQKPKHLHLREWLHDATRYLDSELELSRSRQLVQ